MTYFKDILDKLFPQKLADNKVVLNDIINRSESYGKRYQDWLAISAEKCFDELETSYQEKLLNQENSGVSVHLLHSKYSNGIAISYDERFCSKEEFSFLFDHIADKINQLEVYRKVNSDFIIKEKKTFVETKEKHYLKPFTSKKEAIVDQQFGNILIEHILIDDKPNHITLMANIYSDSLYRKAKEFETLMSLILK